MSRRGSRPFLEGARGGPNLRKRHALEGGLGMAEGIASESGGKSICARPINSSGYAMRGVA